MILGIQFVLTEVVLIHHSLLVLCDSWTIDSGKNFMVSSDRSFNSILTRWQKCPSPLIVLIGLLKLWWKVCSKWRMSCSFTSLELHRLRGPTGLRPNSLRTLKVPELNIQNPNSIGSILSLKVLHSQDIPLKPPLEIHWEHSVICGTISCKLEFLTLLGPVHWLLPLHLVTTGLYLCTPPGQSVWRKPFVVWQQSPQIGSMKMVSLIRFV